MYEKMRTIEVLLFLVITAAFNTVSGQIAVITNLRTGTPDSDKVTQEIFESINNKYIRTVVFLGDITNSGDEKDFLQFGSLIEKYLDPDDYIIPGMRDIQNNPAGYYFVKDQFDGTKVRLDSSALLLAGLSNYSPRGSKYGFHFNDITWLDSLLNKIPTDRKVFFFSPAPLEKTDNWYKVFNLLSEKTSKFLFTIGSENMISGFNGVDEIIFKPSVENGSWNYNIITCDEDSIYLSNYRNDASLHDWGSVSINNKETTDPIDTALVNNFSSEVIWNIETAKTLAAPILVTENRIFYAALNGEIGSLDLNGKSIWKINIERTITTRPVRDKDLIVLGTAEGDLFSINANNGNIVQVIGTGEPLVTDPILINVENLYGKYKGVVVAAPSGRMLCYDIYSFELIWDINEVNNKVTSLIGSEGKLYITSGSFLYCIDWNNGTLIWKWNAGKGASITSVPENDSKNIYLSANKIVYAVDLLLGSTVWKKNDLASAISLKLSEDKKELYIKGASDEFISIEPLTGKTIKKIKCGFPADNEHSYILNNDADILFSTSDGMVRKIQSQTDCLDLFFLGGGSLNSFEQMSNGNYLVGNDQGTIISFKIK